MTTPELVTETLYCISWESGHRPYLLDTDDRLFAQELAIKLAEIGRTDIFVTPVAYQYDPEMRGRVWARIEEKLKLRAAGEEARWRPLFQEAAG